MEVSVETWDTLIAVKTVLLIKHGILNESWNNIIKNNKHIFEVSLLNIMCRKHVLWRAVKI